SFPPITIPVTVTGAAGPKVLNQPTANGHGGSWNPEVDDTIPVVQKAAWTVTQAADSSPLRQGDPSANLSVHIQQTSQAATPAGSPIPAVIALPAAVNGVLPLGQAPLSVGGSGWACTVGTPANGATCTRSDARSGAGELPVLHEVVAVCAASCPASTGN